MTIMANIAIPKTAENSRKRPLSRRLAAWLFSHKHFHLKLLSGTTAGAVVIIFLAGVFLYVTLRNHYQDTLRAHTMEVMRLSGLVENDIAALESGHRGFLLTGDPRFQASFENRREQFGSRMEQLTSFIIDSPVQRKRIMRVQSVVQDWVHNLALPAIKSRREKGTADAKTAPNSGGPLSLGNSLLDQAREVLQSLQDEEQIALNQRMHDQDWATQSTQILDFLPKLERSVLEMEKEKRGYLLTGDDKFSERYKRALADFSTYDAYLSILVASSPAQAEL